MDRLARDQVASFVVLFALNFGALLCVTVLRSLTPIGSGRHDTDDGDELAIRRHNADSNRLPVRLPDRLEARAHFSSRTSILCSRLVLNLRADGAIGNFSSSAAGVSHATSSGARRSALPANRFKWQEPTSPTRPTDVLPHHSFIALGPVSPRSRAIIISEEQVVTISSKDRDEAEV